MNKLFTFLGSGLLLSFMSCNQHEIVPAPLPVADLECSCKADIDGIEYEYTDTCSYDNEKTINTTGASRGIYSSEVQNQAMTEGFELEMRTVEWIDGGSNLPTTDEWKAYFQNNMSPSYYINDSYSVNGVVIKWIDPNGDLWQSDTTLDCTAIDFLYTSMVHDSDQTGNYMKFKSVFNCPLIKFDNSDTVCVENGVMKTSFRRE